MKKSWHRIQYKGICEKGKVNSDISNITVFKTENFRIYEKF